MCVIPRDILLVVRGNGHEICNPEDLWACFVHLPIGFSECSTVYKRNPLHLLLHTINSSLPQALLTAGVVPSEQPARLG